MLITSTGELEFADVPDPRPDDQEVMIEVAAASVNRADLAQRQGRHDRGPMDEHDRSAAFERRLWPIS